MTSSPDALSFTLNSFVRRTRNTDQLKALIAASGARLSRQGRSRNWHLNCTLEQMRRLQQALAKSNDESWLWLNKLLEDQQPSLDQHQLKALARNTPGITINELCQQSRCTIKDARQVLDELEWE